MELKVHPTALAVCSLDASAPVPAWVTDTADPLISVTRTPDELSIVVPEAAVAASARAETGWRALSVKGPLDLSMTGVLASLSVPLADAGIPIFVVSTYDTDWLLVKEDDLDRAIETLLDADLEVTRP